MKGDCNINNLAKNQVSAVFNSRAIRRSMSPKFIESVVYRKTKNPFGTKIRLNISFQQPLNLIKVKYQQDQ